MVSMQSLRALVRFWFLQLVAATPAAPPGSIVILEPGENSFTIQWSPGLSNDCTFQAWQVQVRSRNLNGTLVGSWRQATEVPTSRDSPNCTVDGLQRNSPYDLQIFERCANGADDSSAGEPEQVLWTLPGYWEIHIPPHDASSYVVEDTLEAHAGCEVIKSCCDDQFSLCFSGNESRTVEVQRVDTELGWWQQVGWGQDLYLRCHAPSVAAFKDDPISKEVPEPPWYLRLYEPTHVTAQVVFHHGNFIGGCQCANHQLQTRPHGSSTWRNESGDCLFRDQRHCNIQELQANARIYGRMQTTCLDESMNSNWSEVVEVITRPACTWTYDSSIQGAAANELECVDKTFCDFDADSSCCSSAGGRLRCPQNYPIMCENQDCVGSTDYCCVSTESECGNYGGVRVCTASMVPAEVPRFEDFNSYLASSLKITWSRGIYLSEDDSPCPFSMWHIEMVECPPGFDQPCCSALGWCGRSGDHCKCEMCSDYRYKANVTFLGMKLKKAKRECETIAADLGPFSTPEECARTAANDGECGKMIMFSFNYPNWGCRCCAIDTPEGDEEKDAWNVYAYEVKVDVLPPG